MARVMAAIHSADVVASGLGDFGKVEDYCARQVSLSSALPRSLLSADHPSNRRRRNQHEHRLHVPGRACTRTTVGSGHR